VTRPRTWTDEQLARVAPRCRTWGEVVVELGLGPYAVNRQTVKRRAAQLGITLARTRPDSPRKEGGR
jgi:hypothetical protein